jgi:hypothetical protein
MCDQVREAIARRLVGGARPQDLVLPGPGAATASRAALGRRCRPPTCGGTWGLWHLPLYACFLPRADFRATTSLSWPLLLLVLFAGTIAAAVVFGELRLRTGSIWPGVVMHTVNGAVVGTLIVLLGLVGLALLPRRSKPPAGGGSRRPVAGHG